MMTPYPTSNASAGPDHPQSGVRQSPPVSDLYTITVLARDGGVIDLAVDIVHPDVVDIPLSPSFAAMLIEDEWGPGAAAHKAW